MADTYVRPVAVIAGFQNANISKDDTCRLSAKEIGSPDTTQSVLVSSLLTQSVVFLGL